LHVLELLLFAYAFLDDGDGGDIAAFETVFTFFAFNLQQSAQKLILKGDIKYFCHGW